MFDFFELPSFVEQGENLFFYRPHAKDGTLLPYVQCRAHETRLLPDTLREKYKEINTLVAICDDDTEFDLVITKDKPHLTGGHVRTPNQPYFRHFTYEDRRYKVEMELKYDNKEAEQNILRRFLKGSTVDEEDFFLQTNETPSELTTPPPFPGGGAPGKMTGDIYIARKMTFFLYVDRTISDRYASNSEILSAVTIMMSYMNGIYNRELGLYFQIPDVQDKLFCSAENNCNHPTHSAKLDLLKRLKGYIDDLMPNTNTQQINIFHGIGNFAGGVAYTPSFCVLTYGGVSGAYGRNIASKDFVVNLIAHEVGHQVNMRHSFRDCYGDQAKVLSVEDAIEPGSGNSIMSYAGFCPGGKNIESSAYPYFTAVSIHRSRNALLDLYESGCGEVTQLTQNQPHVEAMTDFCYVPLGGKFGVSANVTNGVFYSWELNNTGFLPFGVVENDEPIMQSYFPSTYIDRWMPNFYNLFFLSPSDYTSTEYIPKASPQEAHLLLMTRTQFSLTSDPLTSYSALSSGMVLQNSSKLIWQNKAKLAIESIVSTNSTNPYFVDQEPLDITWATGDNLGNTIEILFGKKPSTWSQHEPHLFRPTFTTLHTGPNDGSQSVVLPINDTDVYEGIFIVRTTDDPFCFHWDGVKNDINGVVSTGSSSSSSIPIIAGAAGGGVVVLMMLYYFFSGNSSKKPAGYVKF